MQRCTDPQMHWCTDALMHWCTDASMHLCTDACLMHWCSNDALMPGYIDALMLRCTDAVNPMQIFRLLIGCNLFTIAAEEVPEHCGVCWQHIYNVEHL